MDEIEALQVNENIIYQNIIETQKTQADFMKWKILISAIIGAASLGIYGSPQNKIGNSHNIQNYLACLIPLVCAYVDAMFFHLWFRIMIIGKYFRTNSNSCFNCYENAIEELRQQNEITEDWFFIERYAVVGSSLILNLLVLVFGFVVNGNIMIYIIFTTIGIMFTLFLYYFSTKEMKKDIKHKAAVFENK